MQAATLERQKLMRIDATGIKVSLDGKPILRGVDISVAAGEVVGLIGANGVGKSTLLRVLAGVMPADAGTILFDGKPRAAFTPRELACQIAFLAQNGGSQWSLNAETVVALGRLPYRRPFAGLSPADHRAIDTAMTATETQHLRHRTLGTLSGGERMRVLLARALAVNGRIMLADEPIAALDPLHQLQAMQMLRAAARADGEAGGTGIVVVLHDLTLAARFCDRLVLMAEGHVLADGPPGTVLSDANVARAYGVSLARGTHEGERFLLPWSIAHQHDSPHP